MVEAAKESLKALGVDDRQALFVCHNDEPHAHVHVIVNRVSMEDGRAANIRGDHLKLSRWAENWEKRHGKVWCEARMQNNERRGQGAFKRGSTDVPRSVFEAIRDGTRALNDNRDARQAATEQKADQQRKAVELMAQGRAILAADSMNFFVILCAAFGGWVLTSSCVADTNRFSTLTWFLALIFVVSAGSIAYVTYKLLFRARAAVEIARETAQQNLGGEFGPAHEQLHKIFTWDVSGPALIATMVLIVSLIILYKRQ